MNFGMGDIAAPERSKKQAVTSRLPLRFGATSVDEILLVIRIQFMQQPGKGRSQVVDQNPSVRHDQKVRWSGFCRTGRNFF